MTKTLVSFLGRARQDTKTGYRQARYRFPDGQELTTAFFGVTLRDVPEHDRLVLRGIRRIMWNLFTCSLCPRLA